MEEIEKILFQTLSKGWVSSEYCPEYRATQKSRNSKIFRTLYVSKMKIDIRKNMYKFFYRCSKSEFCYQPKCPWSIVSCNKSKEEEEKEVLEPFANLNY